MTPRLAEGSPGPIRPAATEQVRTVALGLDPLEACAALSARQSAALLLDGSGCREGWRSGPLVAETPQPLFSGRFGSDSAPAAIERLARLVGARRRRGGTCGTGIAALLAYDLRHGRPGGGRDDDGLPEMVVLSVDRSLRWTGTGDVLWTVAPAAHGGGVFDPEELVALPLPEDDAGAARARGRPRTSLPRTRYLQAVGSVRRHIARGDIYQANLCQRLAVEYAGDELELYRRLSRRTPAPRSSFFRAAGVTVASLSPETFLRVEPAGAVATWPIKGTRPRHADPQADARAVRELLDSPKERAELLMIVDLERNDLGRICRPGSIRVPQLAALSSFATVHHLVGEVRGELAPDQGVAEILQATFPGGSITGAPKRRAIEILEQLEPVRRNYFTGSLFWFGDDGSVDSSILIRTLVLAGGRALLGAGGGIVADSDPEAEWLESNHKARPLAAALGFDPTEAR